jgi:hypothetical protein
MIECLVKRPSVTFYYNGMPPVVMRVPSSNKQAAALYGGLKRAFKLEDEVVITGFYVDTHNGGPLCPFRLVNMLR